MQEVSELWPEEIGVMRLRKFLRVMREENPVESDTEDSEILEEWEQVPLRIRIPDARGRVGTPAAEVPTWMVEHG